MTWAEVRRRLGEGRLEYLGPETPFMTIAKWLDVLRQLQRLKIRPPNEVQRYRTDLFEMRWRKIFWEEPAWTVVIDWDGRVSIYQGEVTPTLLYDTRHTSMARPTAR